MKVSLDGVVCLPVLKPEDMTLTYEIAVLSSRCRRCKVIVFPSSKHLSSKWMKEKPMRKRFVRFVKGLKGLFDEVEVEFSKEAGSPSIKDYHFHFKNISTS